MPATSKAQRRLMAIAEHHPGEVYGRNRGVLKMTHTQLHDFAKTKEKRLPEYHEKRRPERNLGSRRHGNLDWTFHD
jgi:hypothetical protein